VMSKILPLIAEKIAIRTVVSFFQIVLVILNDNISLAKT